ncbi:putative ammonium transporter 2 [Patiria miniata]|uniref:Ammonium transporter n=1 Tax=Patiria miniata TaxID=46514 RepID=A0A914B846_PATMI|nr:putative ammonium transporter 2 [Patiria miniata]
MTNGGSSCSPNMSGSCNAAVLPATDIVPVTGTFPPASLPPHLQNYTVVRLPSIVLNTRWDDATWILTSAFIIFTMQSGFGLLESGSVSQKNEVNIMVKNAVDVLFGGISYWMFGYGLSFDKIGSDQEKNHPFVGLGEFFVDETDPERVGNVFSHFFFHASFATTATTIVSGAMAERTKLEAYIIFSFLNTLIYCFPAHWMWDCAGWLKAMGVVDIAGAGAVHLVGGVTGLIATLMLKPRTGRFHDGVELPAMGSPTNTVFGMFMLWWGWLGFNCGSTYGISHNKWILAARSAACTITASIGGGMTAITLSYLGKRRKFDVTFLINGVLGSLVSITAMCALAHPWEAYIIGVVGSLIACTGCLLTERLRIDDPVSVVPVHALGAIWSLMSVGIFGRKDALAEKLTVYDGLLAGGGFKLLGIQALAIISIITWTAITSFVLLKLIDLTLGLRVPLHEEILGADLVEHSINGTYDKSSHEWRDRDGKLVMVVERFRKGETLDNMNPRDASRLRRMSLQRTSSNETMKSAFGFVRTEEVSMLDTRAETELAGSADAESGDENGQPTVMRRRRGIQRLRRLQRNNVLGKRSGSWTPRHSSDL